MPASVGSGSADARGLRRQLWLSVPSLTASVSLQARVASTGATTRTTTRAAWTDAPRAVGATTAACRLRPRQRRRTPRVLVLELVGESPRRGTLLVGNTRARAWALMLRAWHLLPTSERDRADRSRRPVTVAKDVMSLSSTKSFPNPPQCSELDSHRGRCVRQPQQRSSS